MKESVLSFDEKSTQAWFTYFQIPGKYYIYVKTKPLNIIVDDFSTRKGNRGKAKCPSFT